MFCGRRRRRRRETTITATDYLSPLVSVTDYSSWKLETHKINDRRFLCDSWRHLRDHIFKCIANLFWKETRFNRQKRILLCFFFVLFFFSSHFIYLLGSNASLRLLVIFFLILLSQVTFGRTKREKKKKQTHQLLISIIIRKNMFEMFNLCSFDLCFLRDFRMTERDGMSKKNQSTANLNAFHATREEKCLKIICWEICTNQKWFG